MFKGYKRTYKGAQWPKRRGSKFSRPMVKRKPWKYQFRKPQRNVQNIPHYSRENTFRIGNAIFEKKNNGMSIERIGTIDQKEFIPRRVTVGESVYVKHGKSFQRVLSRDADIVNKAKGSTEKTPKKPGKFCLFFNKFGTCLKGDKCPHIHDPSKVAVCRNFLKGNCKRENCPLSHNIDRDKMPICSYFLEGCCDNPDCHYLHVKLDPRTPICEAFQTGFCPNGSKCSKQHILLKKPSSTTQVKSTVESVNCGINSEDSESSSEGDSDFIVEAPSDAEDIDGLAEQFVSACRKHKDYLEDSSNKPDFSDKFFQSPFAILPKFVFNEEFSPVF
eukprot:TRINITY_DN775957_c0_g1_i1.p1 TRINITY_DN775957_c0_g1~~TRINITY_DN775957_c0_g1_i1.p1  ORF type:complete len:331 (-),score=47.01 TRINITY_DN775957_c0_g1_i1:47-1039(-)